MNGFANDNSILVLYKVVNSESDANDPSFNAFQMPRGRGPTLASVKQKCAALHSLSHLGPDGFHWRVCVEDKPAPGVEGKCFSWWDIQDENAKLPVKEATQSEIKRLFAPPKPVHGDVESAAKAAKGAFKSFGKAVSSAVTGAPDVSTDTGPRVGIIAFKLLDLIKMHDDFSSKHGGKSSHSPAPPPSATTSARSSRPAPSTHRPTPSTHRPEQQRPRTSAHPPPQSAARTQAHPPVPPPPRAPQQEPSLLNFDTPGVPRNRKVLHHTSSSPAAFTQNETRAEKLKREYEQKKQTANRVWDDIDQRWVEVDPKAAVAGARATASAPPGASSLAAPKKKEVGIKLDPASAKGKSAHVQQAVHKRVADMQNSQQKALQEVRQREAQKKKEEAEEDAVRRQLDPKIKAWSEEHGKKKQLRALLASLHTILWPEANWKPMSLGDILDDSRCKRCFHKASRVVHPDKTHHLDAEKRFLAKRIFDALSQAKTNFDNGAK